MTLEPMKDAARLILHHQEHWDGSGFPDRLKGEAIPFGARLLKLAVDFVELQRGLILERQMNSDEPCSTCTSTPAGCMTRHSLSISSRFAPRSTAISPWWTLKSRCVPPVTWRREWCLRAT